MCITHTSVGLRALPAESAGVESVQIASVHSATYPGREIRKVLKQFSLKLAQLKFMNCGSVATVFSDFLSVNRVSLSLINRESLNSGA